MAAYESWTVEFELATWTDVTARVDTAEGPFEITLGDTPEASTDPGSVALPIRNHDQWATPGNPLSPLYGYLKPGMRCRIKDSPGDQITALFTGYLGFPEIFSWTVSTPDSPREQTVTLPFVDLVSFVENSNTLAATYTEWTRHNGRGDLVAHWPLTNEQAPFNGVGPVTVPMTTTNSTSGSFNPGARPEPQAGEAPPGLEANGLRGNYLLDASTGAEAYNRILAPDSFAPAIAAGNTVTVVFWVNHRTAPTSLFQQLCQFQILGSSNISVELLRDPSTGVWSLSASGAQTATITAGPVGLNALLPVAIRYCPSPASMELWVGSVRLTTTPSGAAPTGLTLDGPDFGFQFGAYDLSGVSVYIGQTWGYEDFLALIEQAHAPLERQTTGERIRTALTWAGIDVATDFIDPGVAVMQSARTAGRKAPALIDEAVETEQGEYYANGDGLPVFADRQRLYDV